MSKWFCADIGSWECGRVYIFKEKSLKKAINRAWKIANKINKDVVQIRIHDNFKKPKGLKMHFGKCIYYM